MNKNTLLTIISIILLLIIVIEVVYYSKFIPIPQNEPSNTPVVTKKSNNQQVFAWQNWQSKFDNLLTSRMVTEARFDRIEPKKYESGQYLLYLRSEKADDNKEFYIYYIKDKTSQIIFYDSNDEQISENDFKKGDLLTITEEYQKNAPDNINYKLIVKKRN